MVMPVPVPLAGPPLWDIPGAEPVQLPQPAALAESYSQEQQGEEERPASPERKKVGFWAWVAGADGDE